ncbi:MAG: hypothetical protein K2Y37_15690 [Pirellulales bacterium]|nr:hypothetical protein [Pirellulales bacterium]
MHEHTQRTLCRLGFVACCILPTLGTLGWACRLGSSGHVASCEAQLVRRLGLTARIGAVEHPRPGQTRMCDVVLAEPETHETVARLPRLEITASRRGTMVRLSEPRIVATALAGLWIRLNQQLAATDDPLRLEAKALVWQGPAAEYTLNNIAGGVSFADKIGQAYLSFTLDTPAAHPVRMRVVRDRRHAPAHVTWELQSPEAAIPCGLAWPWIDVPSWMGDACRFRGTLRGQQSGAGSRTEIVGHFVEVDLRQLVSEHFPHHLSGLAELQVHSARLVDGRIEQLSAAAVGGPGQVSRSLLAGGWEMLEMPAGPLPPPAVDRIAYERLALAFLLDARGLVVEGRCSKDLPGAVLIDANKVLLNRPERPQSVASLVRLLCPPTPHVVPHVREAESLLRVLPLPSTPVGAAAPAIESSAPRTASAIP